MLHHFLSSQISVVTLFDLFLFMYIQCNAMQNKEVPMLSYMICNKII